MQTLTARHPACQPVSTAAPEADLAMDTMLSCVWFARSREGSRMIAVGWRVPVTAAAASASSSVAAASVAAHIAHVTCCGTIDIRAAVACGVVCILSCGDSLVPLKVLSKLALRRDLTSSEDAQCTQALDAITATHLIMAGHLTRPGPPQQRCRCPQSWPAGRT